MMAWEPVGTYSEIYIDGEDGQRYTLGVDGDDNFYVEKQNPARVLLALQPTQYRLCRQVPDGGVILATPERVAALETVINLAELGDAEYNTAVSTEIQVMRAMLQEMKGGE